MKIETMQDLVDELNSAIKTLGYCTCETVIAVSRDMNSTCQQCGGKDAYKSSPLQQVVKALDGKAIVPVELLWRIYEEGDNDLLYKLEPYLIQASQEKDNEC